MQPEPGLESRSAAAKDIAERAAKAAMDYFAKVDSLRVEKKGHQDFVSEADREVELLIRAGLGEAFPDDAIVGEEHDTKQGTSGFTWVIDPIDGTTNFINGIPAWTVVLAGVQDGLTQIAVIIAPCNDETYVATRGSGASLNGRPLSIADSAKMSDGTVGIGYSHRVGTEGVQKLIDAVLQEGSMFYRNASGALSLAYVSAGRLLGYAEEHMNAWDCIAGQLLVEEAGGKVEAQDAQDMIANGGRVVVGVDGVFEELQRACDASFPS